MSGTIRTVHQRGPDAAAAALRFQILCRSKQSNRSSQCTNSHRTYIHDDAITRGVRHIKIIDSIATVWPNRNTVTAQSPNPSTRHQTRRASSTSKEPPTSRFAQSKHSQFSPSEARRSALKPTTQPEPASKPQYRVPTRAPNELEVPILQFRNSQYRLPPPLRPALEVQPTSYRAAWHPFTPASRQVWVYTSRSFPAHLLRKFESWVKSLIVTPKTSDNSGGDFHPPRLRTATRSTSRTSLSDKRGDELFLEIVFVLIVCFITWYLNEYVWNWWDKTPDRDAVETRNGLDAVESVAVSPNVGIAPDETHSQVLAPVAQLEGVLDVVGPGGPVKKARSRGEPVELVKWNEKRAGAQEQRRRQNELRIAQREKTNRGAGLDAHTVKVENGGSTEVVGESKIEAREGEVRLENVRTGAERQDTDGGWRNWLGFYWGAQGGRS